MPNKKSQVWLLWPAISSNSLIQILWWPHVTIPTVWFSFSLSSTYTGGSKGVWLQYLGFISMCVHNMCIQKFTYMFTYLSSVRAFMIKGQLKFFSLKVPKILLILQTLESLYSTSGMKFVHLFCWDLL